MLQRSSRVLLFVALLSTSSFPAMSESSLPNSSLPEPLWTVLLQATNNLPSQIDFYAESWNKQVLSLQANVSDLQTSNDSLTQQNVDLGISLIRSQADLAISEQAQRQSEKALQDSGESITRAQASAKALELQNALLKYGMIGSVAVAIVAIVIAAVK